MFPVLFGLAILVWMWAAAMHHVVQQFAASASPSQQRVYLAMLACTGAAALVAVIAWFMPGSQLSIGWSQERLTSLVNVAALTALVVTALALWRSHLQMPALGIAAALRKNVVAAATPTKKRP